LSQQALERFNAVLSVDKTSFGTSLNDLEVLSYKNTNGIAHREPGELLAKLLYPERARTFGATASAAIGIAYAGMGTNHYVYNTCKDVFDFITEKLDIEPSVDTNSRYYANTYLPRMQWLPNGKLQFPTFEETFVQNFNMYERSESDKQRLWPTKPVGNGFHFLSS